jgi:hypothetical protein
MHLSAAPGEGELARLALDGRLHLEHKPGGGPEPHVEEPPVQPPLRAGVAADGQRRLGQVLGRHRLGDELEAAFTAAGGSLGSRGPRLLVFVTALLTR